MPSKTTFNKFTTYSNELVGRLRTSNYYFNGRDVKNIKQSSDNILLFDYTYVGSTQFLLHKTTRSLFNLYKTTWDYYLYLNANSFLTSFMNQTTNSDPSANNFLMLQMIIDKDIPVTEITTIPSGIVDTIAKIGGLFAIFRFIAIM